MSADEDFRIRHYRRSAEQLVEHLHDLADRIERVAEPSKTLCIDGTPRFAYAAEQVSHELTWGIANAAAYRLFHDAVHADAAEAEVEAAS